MMKSSNLFRKEMLNESLNTQNETNQKTKSLINLRRKQSSGFSPEKFGINPLEYGKIKYLNNIINKNEELSKELKHKQNLEMFSKFIIYIFSNIVNIISILNYILQTYFDPKSDEYSNAVSAGLTYLEVTISIYFVFEYILICLRLNTSLLKHFFSMDSLIDLVTTVPPIINFFFLRSIKIKLSFIRIFRIFRVFRVLRIYKSIRMMRNEENEAFKSDDIGAEETANPITLQIVTGIVILLCNFFIFAGLVLGLQDLVDGAFTVNEMNFFDAFYFIIITCSTTGYGDIYPTHTVSRIFVIVMIVSLFITISNQVSKIVYLLDKWGQGLFHFHTRNHIIVICDASINIFLFISELKKKSHNLEIIILSNEITTLPSLEYPFNKVHLVQVKHVDYEVLERSNAGSAKCIFVFSNKAVINCIQKEKVIDFLILKINQYFSHIPVYVQNLYSEKTNTVVKKDIINKNMLMRLNSFAGSMLKGNSNNFVNYKKVIPIMRIKSLIICKSLVNPGFAAFSQNLLFNDSPLPPDFDSYNPIMKTYLKGCENKICIHELPNFFVYKDFNEAVLQIYSQSINDYFIRVSSNQNYECRPILLIGIIDKKMVMDKSNIKIFPKGYRIKQKNLGIFISYDKDNYLQNFLEAFDKNFIFNEEIDPVDLDLDEVRRRRSALFFSQDFRIKKSLEQRFELNNKKSFRNIKKKKTNNITNKKVKRLECLAEKSDLNVRDENGNKNSDESKNSDVSGNQNESSSSRSITISVNSKDEISESSSNNSDSRSSKSKSELEESQSNSHTLENNCDGSHTNKTNQILSSKNDSLSFSNRLQTKLNSKKEDANIISQLNNLLCKPNLELINNGNAENRIHAKKETETEKDTSILPSTEELLLTLNNNNNHSPRNNIRNTSLKLTNKSEAKSIRSETNSKKSAHEQFLKNLKGLNKGNKSYDLSRTNTNNSQSSSTSESKKTEKEKSIKSDNDSYIDCIDQQEYDKQKLESYMKRKNLIEGANYKQTTRNNLAFLRAFDEKNTELLKRNIEKETYLRYGMYEFTEEATMDSVLNRIIDVEKTNLSETVSNHILILGYQDNLARIIKLLSYHNNEKKICIMVSQEFDDKLLYKVLMQFKYLMLLKGDVENPYHLLNAGVHKAFYLLFLVENIYDKTNEDMKKILSFKSIDYFFSADMLLELWETKSKRLIGYQPLDKDTKVISNDFLHPQFLAGRIIYLSHLERTIALCYNNEFLVETWVELMSVGLKNTPSGSEFTTLSGSQVKQGFPAIVTIDVPDTYLGKDYYILMSDLLCMEQPIMPIGLYIENPLKYLDSMCHGGISPLTKKRRESQLSLYITTSYKKKLMNLENLGIVEQGYMNNLNILREFSYNDKVILDYVDVRRPHLPIFITNPPPGFMIDNGCKVMIMHHYTPKKSHLKNFQMLMGKMIFAKMENDKFEVFNKQRHDAEKKENIIDTYIQNLKVTVKKQFEGIYKHIETCKEKVKM